MVYTYRPIRGAAEETDRLMEELLAQLRSGKYSRIYLLYGSEDYLVRFYSDRLVEKNLSEDDRLMNMQIYEGTAADVGQVSESAATYPFMADKRVTVIRDSGWFQTKGVPEALETFVKEIPNLPDSCLLIFEESQVDKRSQLYKAVSKYGTAAELNQPDQEGMIRFAARELAKYGKQTDRQTAVYFLDKVGGDMIYQQLEIAKLASYAGERQIVTMRDVDAVCTQQAEDNVFKMTDALGGRNKNQAFMIYEKLLEANEAPQRIFYLLAGQVRRMFRMRLAMDRRMPDAECADFCGVSPKAVWIYQKQARRFETGHLAQLLTDMTEMDERMKLSRLEADDAVRQVILKM